MGPHDYAALALAPLLSRAAHDGLHYLTHPLSLELIESF